MMIWGDPGTRSNEEIAVGSDRVKAGLGSEKAAVRSWDVVGESDADQGLVVGRNNSIAIVRVNHLVAMTVLGDLETRGGVLMLGRDSIMQAVAALQHEDGPLVDRREHRFLDFEPGRDLAGHPQRSRKRGNERWRPRTRTHDRQPRLDRTPESRIRCARRPRTASRRARSPAANLCARAFRKGHQGVERPFDGKPAAVRLKHADVTCRQIKSRKSPHQLGRCEYLVLESVT